MPQNVKIQINPEMLTWAREEAGYTPEGIASKLHISVERYAHWEINRENIPFGMVKEMANYFKRQVAVFLLPSSPPRLKRPTDYRNLAVSHAGLSPELLLAMRRAQKYLALARELLGEPYWNDQYNWQNEIENFKIEKTDKFDERLADWLRGKLKISIDEQKKFRRYDDAFKKWRNSIEQELGIFIFQFSMPENEVDGFCYADDKPPYAIVINSNTNVSRKIFTMFHELVHIFNLQSGVCLPEITNEIHNEEYECNELAGKFLVPDAEVSPINDVADLLVNAKKFKVSREVYLRRNFERDFISRRYFFNILKELREQPTPPKGKKPGYPTQLIKSKSSRGEKFYNLVLDAVYNNRIDYTSASDLLGIGFNQLIRYEQ